MNTNKQVKAFILIIIIIIVAGIISLVLYQSKKYSGTFFEYSGFAVHKVTDGSINEFRITFFREDESKPFTINSRYDPRTLEEIKIQSNIREDIVKENLFITMDPNLSSKAVIAFAEINKYTENPFLFNLPTYPALTTKVENNDLPVISCLEVNQTTAVILFKKGNKNEIYTENGCIILEYIIEEDLIKLADRLTLTALGIMKP
ncbi:MAG: hypothetical protein AABX08_02995 [Nanoarchaeota archaeon]